jgi:serine/threonine protein kinase
LDLTPEIIRNFAREANKLAALSKYRHVVKLIGICVRPPSLAMALELCHYGSLYDVIERHYQPSTNSIWSSDKHIILDRRTRLIISLHCSRAVMAMHSLHPPLLHLDLKAQNFLVALRSTDEMQQLRRAASGATEAKSGKSIESLGHQLDLETSFIVKVADLELSTHAGDENIRIPDTHQVC